MVLEQASLVKLQPSALAAEGGRAPSWWTHVLQERPQDSMLMDAAPHFHLHTQVPLSPKEPET